MYRYCTSDLSSIIKIYLTIIAANYFLTCYFLQLS